MLNTLNSTTIAEQPSKDCLVTIDRTGSKSKTERVSRHRLMAKMRALTTVIPNSRSDHKPIGMAMCSLFGVRKLHSEMASTVDYNWLSSSSQMSKTGALFTCHSAYCPVCCVQKQNSQRQVVYDVLKYMKNETHSSALFGTFTHPKQKSVQFNYDFTHRWASIMRKLINNQNRKYCPSHDLSDFANRIVFRANFEQTFSDKWIRCSDTGELYKGIHNHLHSLVWVGQNVDLRDFKNKIKQAYVKHLKDMGVYHQVHCNAYGIDWRDVDTSSIVSMDKMASYVSNKGSSITGISYEVTSSRTKGFGINDLLQRIVRFGCSEDIRIYTDFIKVSFGKRTVRECSSFLMLKKDLAHEQADIEEELLQEEIQRKWNEDLDEAYRSLTSYDDFSYVERRKYEEDCKRVVSYDKKVSLHPDLYNLVVKVSNSVEFMDDIMYSYFAEDKYSDFINLLQNESLSVFASDWLYSFNNSSCSFQRMSLLQSRYDVLFKKLKDFFCSVDRDELRSSNHIFLNSCSHRI